MSRKQQREVDLVERLEQENRELKATVRALQKRLRKVDREYKADLEDASKERHMEEDHNEVKPKAKKCEHCGKGHHFEVDIMGRIFINCSSCDYKARKPK